MRNIMEQLQQIAAQIGIDQSFYRIFVTVVVLYFVLTFVYLRPYQRLLDKRRDSIHGAKKSAQDITARAEAKYGEYKANLKGVMEKAKGVLRAAEESARKEEAGVLGAAGAKAKGELQSVQAQLDMERKAVVDKIAPEISTLAAEVASKALGRSVSPASSHSANGNGNGHR